MQDFDFIKECDQITALLHEGKLFMWKMLDPMRLQMHLVDFWAIPVHVLCCAALQKFAA